MTKSLPVALIYICMKKFARNIKSAIIIKSLVKSLFSIFLTAIILNYSHAFWPITIEMSSHIPFLTIISKKCIIYYFFPSLSFQKKSSFLPVKNKIYYNSLSWLLFYFYANMHRHTWNDITLRLDYTISIYM